MTIRAKMHSVPVSGGDTLHAIELWPDDRSPVETLVFSHGAGGSHVNWYHQVARFSPEHRVVLWDHRGFGKSTNHAQLASPTTASSDLNEIIATISGPAHVIAQSMGGWAALALAAQQPELFRSLVLADTCAGILSEATIHNLSTFVRDSQEHTDRLLGSLAVGERFREGRPDESVLYNLLVKALPVTYPTAVTDLITHPFDGDLMRLSDLPIMAIIGAHDQIFPPEIIQRDLASIPGIRFSVIAGCGHSPYVESPAEFNEALADFLDPHFADRKRTAH